jgi:acyl-coenzyme A thioesterase PaaI-like protein
VRVPDRRVEPLRHHDLCFGCGQANLFGLQLEMEGAGEGAASGRFFVKQDHQGPPGFAHGGILATALDEAMSLLVHATFGLAYTASIDLRLAAPAPVGSFVFLESRLEEQHGRRISASARALAGEGNEGGQELATATAVFVRQASD